MYILLRAFFEFVLFFFHDIYRFVLSFMLFLFQYFTPKCFLLPFHSFVGLSTSILHLLVDRIFFRYFKMPYFVYIAWLCLGSSYVFDISPISFDLPHQVTLSNLSADLFWSFHPNISSCVFPSLTLWLIVAVSLPILLVYFPIQILYFCSGSL